MVWVRSQEPPESAHIRSPRQTQEEGHDPVPGCRVDLGTQAAAADGHHLKLLVASLLS